MCNGFGNCCRIWCPMTSAHQPHPQRCENGCQHYFKMRCSGKHTCQGNWDGYISPTLFRIISVVGCASYSASHTSPSTPAQGLNFRPECPHHMYYEEYMGEPERHVCNKRKEWEAEAAKAAREQFRKMILDMREDGIITSKTWALLFEGIGKLAKESLRAQQGGEP